MRKINFTKMVASGNDFVIVDSCLAGRQALSRYLVISLNKLAKSICDRKFGVGADGLLILEKSKKADIRMRIFNADGSEAEMCGNGARSLARFTESKILKIETKAGIIESVVKGDNVKIKLTNPKGIKLDIPLKVGKRRLKVNFINTGVPHVVIFVEGLDKIDVSGFGRFIRYHQKFAPCGTNVNFVEVAGKDIIRIRTYERGVEDETLACGTGSIAAALIFALKTNSLDKIKVQTKSKEILNVYFHRQKNKFTHVWLEGQAKIVYKGEYYV